MEKIVNRLPKFVIMLGLALAINGCGGSGDGGAKTAADSTAKSSEAPKVEEAPAVDDGKGFGPVKEVKLDAKVDAKMADEGKKMFELKCSACHKITGDKVVGPGLKDVSKRRKPEWIMNMILNPEEMTKKDPTAKKLLAEHMTQMTNQNVKEEDARKILEYLRKNDE